MITHALNKPDIKTTALKMTFFNSSDNMLCLVSICVAFKNNFKTVNIKI